MKKFLFFALFALSINAVAQSFQRIYGEMGDDFAYSVLQTTDGGYIMAGYTSNFGAGQYDVYVVKTNSAGNILWTKAYGGLVEERAYSMQQTSDGGFIIAGSTMSFGGGGSDMYALNIDSIGNVIWAKSYGLSVNESAQSVKQTSDGGYIFIGSSDSAGGGPSFGGQDIFLVKTNANGFTTPFQPKYIGGSFDDNANDVIQTNDGGYAIIGKTYSYGANAGNTGDIYLVKLTSGLTIQYTKTYGNPCSDGNYTSIIQASDNGFVIAGSADLNCVGNEDGIILKTDSLGIVQWSKTYGATSGIDRITSIRQTSDGGYIAVGYNYQTNPSANLLKLNSNGDTLWTRAYGRAFLYDEAYSVQQTNDGGYVLAGFSLAGQPDAYLIKTDSNGFSSKCADFSTNITVNTYTMDTSSGGSIATNGIGGVPAVTSALTTNTTDTILCDCGAFTSNQPICLVTVDSTSTKNVIIWEKPITTSIDSFRVYREFGLNNYVYIESVAYSALSEFTDTTGGVNPNIQSYRYKISVIDTCGNESPLSSHHRTIHLSTPQFTPPSTFDLIWTNDYEGFAISGYNILRDGNNTGVWDSIGFVTFGNFSYTDINAPSDSAKYIIQAAHPTGCTAGKKGTDYNSSVSNSSGILSVPGSLTAIATSTNATQSNCDGSATVTAGGGTPPYTYAWSTVPVQTTTTATGLCGNTTYTVLVTDSAGNTVSTGVLVGELTGLEESGVHSSMLKIYPNPNSGEFTIQIYDLASGESKYNFKIFNVLGKLIYQSQILNPESQISLSLSSGVYQLQVITDKGIANQLIVIH